MVQASGKKAELYRIALRQIEMACQLAPGKADYQKTLGAARFRAGRCREALETLARIVEERPGDDQIPVLIALCHAELGQTEQADQLLTGCYIPFALVQPNERPALVSEALEVIWKGKLPPELKSAQDLVQQLFKKHILKTDVIARIEAMRLDDRRAGTLIRMARTRKDPSPTDLNSTAWKVVARPEGSEAGYRRALREAVAACKLSPEDPSFLNTLGVAQYRVGLYEEAIKTLERADDINRKKPARDRHSRASDLLFVAMCQYRLGRKSDSLKTLEGIRAEISEARRDPEILGFIRETRALIRSGASKK